MRLPLLPLLLLTTLATLATGFVTRNRCFVTRRAAKHTWQHAAIAVPVDLLEQNLTTAERSVTGVVRTCGPSVAYVTSVLSGGRNNNNMRNTQRDPKLPPGRPLGTGSGFVVDKEGYVVTNYHVIERAYMLQRMKQDYEYTISQIVGNVTQVLGGTSTQSLQNLFPTPTTTAQVYVRMDKATNFIKCRVVNVKPDLDVAVLKILNTTSTADLQPMSFGSSSSLLVGQSLVAIGNPFGLDTSVTSGVVSALNRELQVTGSGTNVIRNCIQTDASINPGNSGGPLLNLDGEVIGVNTAIVTTSGSSAGVGFAIPSDEVEPVVREMIREDALRESKLGWLGVSIVKPTTSTKLQGNWVASVQPNSPASGAGIQSLSILNDGRLQLGDCIVAIGGNELSNFEALREELEKRKKGEELAVTLQDSQGDRRVVYLKLGTMPTKT